MNEQGTPVQRIKRPLNNVALCHNTNAVAAIVYSVLGLSAVAAPKAAHSQQGVSRAVEEVLVTARRREESVQDVPIAISTFGGDELLDRGVENLRDLNAQLPTFKITATMFGGNAGTTIRVRGLPGVVIYEDGVPSIAAAAQSIVDMERVEVLRGPQGTLFGRTAMGGALQLISRKPTKEFGGQTSITFGNSNRIDVSGRVNIPITDTVFAKFFAASEQREGFVQSTAVPYLQLGSQDDKLARADFLWAPNEQFEGRLIYTYNEQKSNGTPTTTLDLLRVCPGDPLPDRYQLRNGAPFAAPPNLVCIIQTVNVPTKNGQPWNRPWDTSFHEFASIEEYKTTIDKEMPWLQENHSTVLDLSYALTGKIDLRWISGYRDLFYRGQETQDGTSLEIYERTAYQIPNGDTKQTTSEFQVLYNGERFSGTSGLYYEYRPGAKSKRVSWANGELLEPELRAAALAVYPQCTNFSPGSACATFVVGKPPIQGSIVKTKTEIMAAFAEWTYSVTDALDLTAGVRYTDQTTTNFIWGGTAAQPSVLLIPNRCCDLDSSVDYLATAGSPVVRETPLEEWTPRVSIQYRWTPSLMTYFTYAKATTTGGTNNNPTPGLPVAPVYAGEKVKSYELGVRSDWLNGRVRMNATAFFNDYKDLQLLEELLIGTFVTSNADGEVKGAEVEGFWRLTDELMLNYSVGYLDTEYTGAGNTVKLRLGTSFDLVPKVAYSIGLQQGWRLSSGAGLSLRGDWSWQDDMESHEERTNSITIPAYGLLNSRLTYTDQSGNWDVALSGTNLTDEYYWNTGIHVNGASTAVLSRPREFGLSFSYRF